MQNHEKRQWQTPELVDLRRFHFTESGTNTLATERHCTQTFGVWYPSDVTTFLAPTTSGRLRDALCT